MADLHSRIRTELDRRLAIARAAEAYSPPPWNGGWDDARVCDHNGGGVAYDVPGDVLVPYLLLHDPSDAVLRYTRDLAVLERHAPKQAFDPKARPDLAAQFSLWLCSTCYVPGEGYDDYGGEDDWPCDDITLLAESLGIPTTPKGDA